MNLRQLTLVVVPFLLAAFLGCTDEVDQDAIPKLDAALDQKSDAPPDGHADASEGAASNDAAVTSDASVATDANAAVDAVIASDAAVSTDSAAAADGLAE